MDAEQIKNAVIESVSLTMGEAGRGTLTVWLQLSYGGTGQGFGGYALYLPKSYSHHKEALLGANTAGHFIARVLEVAGVEDWDDLKGKTIRVSCDDNTVHAIGHIVKDDWFNPSEDFKSGTFQYPVTLSLPSAPGESKFSEFAPIIYSFAVRNPCSEVLQSKL